MMRRLSSLGERRRDASTTRVAVTITGDVSPAEQVDALAVREVSRRLHAETDAASHGPALDETA
jgi:hypothetical protein